MRIEVLKMRKQSIDVAVIFLDYAVSSSVLSLMSGANVIIVVLAASLAHAFAKL